MPTRLLLATDQENRRVNPYRFKMTGVNVYSLEEALYHCYYHWQESVDDFLSEEFIEWINSELSLTYIASAVSQLKFKDGFSERFIGFLTLIDYFDEGQILRLKSKLDQWEKHMEWERLKLRADNLLNANEPEKAYLLYERALIKFQNAEIYNNMAVALMRLEKHKQAIELLKKAIALQSQDEELGEVSPEKRFSGQLMLNLTEALIYNHDFEEALRNLEQLAKTTEDAAIVIFLYGELNYEAGNYTYARDYFIKALEQQEDTHYIYRLSEAYIKLRQYDQALTNLERVRVKNRQFLLKQADIYFSTGNIPAAIKSIERALTLVENSKAVELWTRLAKYRRLDYDLEKAEQAILMALRLDEGDQRANLEYARIKKANGKIREYRAILHNILSGFKSGYRDIS